MWKAEETPKNDHGSLWMFYLSMSKGIKHITHTLEESVALGSKWPFSRMYRSCPQMCTHVPQGACILAPLYEQMKYSLSISLCGWLTSTSPDSWVRVLVSETLSWFIHHQINHLGEGNKFSGILQNFNQLPFFKKRKEEINVQLLMRSK